MTHRADRSRRMPRAPTQSRGVETGRRFDEGGGEVDAQDFADAGVREEQPAAGAGSRAGASAFAAPPWVRDLGRWSWILIGVILVLAAVFVAVAAVRLVVLATLFAILFGSTFLPVVDWLQKHHLRRWMGALVVLLMLIALALLVGLVIVYGIVNQVPTIEKNLQAATDSIKQTLGSTSVPQSTVDDVKSGLQSLLQNAAGGAASAVGTLISGMASLIFGIFISVNIMVWVLIQGRPIGTWASRHAHRSRSPSRTRSSPTARASSAATFGGAPSSACSTAA